MKHIDVDALYASQPPPFGAALKLYFALNPDYINLNNGSYGAAPIPVHQAISTLTDEIESNPDLFHKLTYIPRLIKAREEVAGLIGAKTEEVVFVTNTSMGVNTVLRNFEWEEGDTIIITSTTYGSVYQTAQYISDSPPHPTISLFPLTFPTKRASIVASFREHIQSIPKKEGKKKVAIIDSIVSLPGVRLPWNEMVEICKEEGVYSIIDAAHSIGQEDVDLSVEKPDFWVSNCHKWLHCKRSVAVLYVPERNQHIIKTSIPTSATYISPANRTGPNFIDQFEWSATIDFAPQLTVPDALKFRAWLGGEQKINEYCHSLAIRGGKRLAEILETEELDPEGEFTLNMVNVLLPLPAPFTPAIRLALIKALLEKNNAFAQIFYHAGKWWIRASAQVWNEMEDFEKLGKILLVICKEVLEGTQDA